MLNQQSDLLAAATFAKVFPIQLVRKNQKKGDEFQHVFWLKRLTKLWRCR